MDNPVKLSSFFSSLEDLRMDVPYFRNTYVRGTFPLLEIQDTTIPTTPWPQVNVLPTCYEGNGFHQRSGAPEGQPPILEAVFAKEQHHVPLHLAVAHFSEKKVRAPDGSRGHLLEHGQSFNIFPGEIK
ncbi:hypothetical protein PRBEI_2001529000 [Prionailurus iriomotensis]